MVSVDQYWAWKWNEPIINEAVREEIEHIRSQRTFPALIINMNDLMDLVEACLKINPERRPKAREVSKRLTAIFEEASSQVLDNRIG
jgi:hypothetical protein